VLGEVVLFAQHHPQAAPAGVARDPGAIDAATYYQYVAINPSWMSAHLASVAVVLVSRSSSV
jgi:hypothetical protein